MIDFKNYCFVCGGGHPHEECPLMQPPKPPELGVTVEEPKRSSLPLTQFEDLFGEGAEGVLLDVLDRPDVFDKDQQDLATTILSGENAIRTLDDEERERLDGMTRTLARLKKYEPSKKKLADPRPAYVRTKEEMEDFTR